ncbi:MAG: FHA domain-containing protein [Methylobacter sp.]|nr:FHA domain-containing protein [Methylobacter sp.]
MDDDKTVLRRIFRANSSTDYEKEFSTTTVDELSVDLINLTGHVAEQFKFIENFTVGRANDNHIVINHDTVSRYHFEIKYETNAWWLYNLKSMNGIYIDGHLVSVKQKLQFPAIIAIGLAGIQLHIRSSNQSVQQFGDTQDIRLNSPANVANRSLSLADIQSRLLAKEETDDMGDYTLLVRRVIQQDRVVHIKSYKKIIWLLGCLFSVAVALVTYQQLALNNARKLALDMFYDVKALEVNLAQADIKLDDQAEVVGRALEALNDEKLRVEKEELKIQQLKTLAEKQHMFQERQRLVSMKAKYRQYVEEANTFRLSFPTAKQYEKELMAKVARELGESELELPDEFISEVYKYIDYWKTSNRLQTAINNMEQNNLLPMVISTLEKQGLPLYFIYLPLQESNYNLQAVGPETRFGIAKGAWQLLAGTAQQYGVTPGPLANISEYDPQDDRFDFAKATQAGTKYLKHIYSTEAQASGLLVMASYNYGDNRVKAMISRLPDNPRDRCFWNFMQQYELPIETRDYVFYIFSAAVIGEDPQHFGFKFNPPLYKTKS